MDMKTSPRFCWQLVALATCAAGMVHPPAANAASDEAADDRRATEVAAFTFGPPTSVTRRGFAKVTVGDAFSAGKGFGFESATGLLAYDRGGSEIVPPKDEYTA